MRKIFLCILIVLVSVKFHAQNLTHYENLLTPDFQKDIIASVTSSLTEGREAGKVGNLIAGRIIADKFKAMGLVPYRWHYTQGFRLNDTLVGRNIVGYVPAVKPSDEYIVVSAHYDHLGRIRGRIYPGADDNASGVAALISIAQMFRQMRSDGAGPKKNILFVAFDGKELDMSGSLHFVRNMGLPREKIVCNVNMDILGSNLVPPGKDAQYLIALGEETLPARYRGHLARICGFNRDLRMDLSLSFYGSRDFTRMMYSLGDHDSFARTGIPAVFFTSGFHQHTYKQTDTMEIIDFELLRKRTAVIFEFINCLCTE